MIEVEIRNGSKKSCSTFEVWEKDGVVVEITDNYRWGIVRMSVEDEQELQELQEQKYLFLEQNVEEFEIVDLEDQYSQDIELVGDAKREFEDEDSEYKYTTDLQEQLEEQNMEELGYVFQSLEVIFQGDLIVSRV